MASAVNQTVRLPALPQAGVILAPVRHLVLLLGNVVPTVLVQLERQGRDPGIREGAILLRRPGLQRHRPDPCNNATLVTTCYRRSERGKAQALNDFLVFGTTATASFMAGFMQERLGWHPLNWLAVVLAAVAVVAVGWLRLQRQPLHAST
jgi:hypothetical protein